MPISSKERLASLETSMQDVKTDVKDLNKTVKEGFDKVSNKLDNNFVTKTEFLPVKNIAFGMVGLILSIVATAIVTSIVKAYVIK